MTCRHLSQLTWFSPSLKLAALLCLLNPFQGSLSDWTSGLLRRFDSFSERVHTHHAEDGTRVFAAAGAHTLPGRRAASSTSSTSRSARRAHLGTTSTRCSG